MKTSHYVYNVLLYKGTSSHDALHSACRHGGDSVGPVERLHMHGTVFSSFRAPIDNRVHAAR